MGDLEKHILFLHRKRHGQQYFLTLLQGVCDLPARQLELMMVAYEAWC